MRRRAREFAYRNRSLIFKDSPVSLAATTTHPSIIIHVQLQCPEVWWSVLDWNWRVVYLVHFRGWRYLNESKKKKRSKLFLTTAPPTTNGMQGNLRLLLVLGHSLTAPRCSFQLTFVLIGNWIADFRRWSSSDYSCCCCWSKWGEKSLPDKKLHLSSLPSTSIS